MSLVLYYNSENKYKFRVEKSYFLDCLVFVLDGLQVKTWHLWSAFFLICLFGMILKIISSLEEVHCRYISCDKMLCECLSRKFVMIYPNSLKSIC